MLGSIMLAALATVTLVEPQIRFTSDSVYTKESIVQIEPIEREDTETTYLVDLQFTFDKLLGYEVYDDPSTDYIDGVKINDTWLSKSMYYEGFDPTKENIILIKTVYSDDYAGMVMAAKDGDWSLLLKNPETLLRLAYYLLATLSVIITLCTVMFGKKRKAKTVNEVEEGVSAQVDLKLNALIDLFVKPLLMQTEVKYENIIKSLILSKSKNPEDAIAMVEMLKTVSSKEELDKLAESFKSNVKAEAESKAKIINDAKEAVSAIEKVVDDVKKDSYDGTQI